MPDVFILSAARTPIGKYGGSFRALHPAELGATAVRAALDRARIDPMRTHIDELIVGHARQAGAGPNPARQVAHRAGIPHEVPAYTVNKACASGLQAVASGAQMIAHGDADIVVAGGMESMSRVPYLMDADVARWGHRMGHFDLVDAMYRDGFLCPLCGLVMGETAELVARRYGITREQSDCYALDTQRRAEAAGQEHRFEAEIAPVTVRDAKETREIRQDEHPRPGTTIEALRKLPPVFTVDGQPGVITAGSASGITDGGAALVLASEARARTAGVVPMARIVGWTSAGVDPRMMGIGPVPAVRKLMVRTGLSLSDFDLIELNEAFAVQVLAVMRDLELPAERVNVSGGAIALGHPIGCSGARILVTLAHEMRRRRARLGLATLCVSGGMGMAMAVERTE